MQTRKIAPACALLGALSIALCGIAILSNRHKAALKAEALREIQRGYGPTNRDPGVMITVSLPVNEKIDKKLRVDSYTIKNFSWQGDFAKVAVKFHTRYPTIDVHTRKRRHYESFGTTQDTWQKLNGHWTCTGSSSGERRDLVDGVVVR